MAMIGKYGKVIFSDDDIQFIKDNFQSMTNQAIADALGLKKTVVRTKAYELGLQRMELEFWPDEAVEYLKNNYRTIGNIELANYFNVHYPKKKKWSKHHIDKKMEYLNLKRSKIDWYNIVERNLKNGSFGKPNPRRKRKEYSAVIVFKEKKYLLQPGQTRQELFEQIIQNKVQPIVE